MCIAESQKGVSLCKIGAPWISTPMTKNAIFDFLSLMVYKV